jgi:pyruvate/2-oxoglutarate dehydrogenase complex dihydrolipoamide dehydrogenase (E3) component
MNKSYDAIIIGTGQSGPFLAIRLAKAGRKVAIIERGLFGGTCVNTGCIPTKTLVASARVAYMARRATEFGVNIGEVNVDMKKVKARKDTIQRPSQEGAETRLREQPNCDVYKSQARFESPHVIAVGDERLTSDQIFINVGGRASVPPIRGLDQVPYLNNSSMMAVDFLPDHLIVVGGSYIGLEFGQMYRRFGSKVTILQRESRLIPREDPDISDAIKDIVEREGITVRLNATCITLEKRGDQVVAGVDCTENPSPVTGSHVLLATGRRPNTDDLGLDKAGVEAGQTRQYHR